MAERDKSKKTSAETGSLADYDEYKKQRNKVSTLLKAAKSND